MKIICGTDFSMHAAGAANVAAALAARSREPLRLVHALESSGLEFLSKPQVDQLREKLRSKLVAERRRLRAAGAEVRESLAVGIPHEVLVAAVKQWSAGLIVVSSLGWISPVQMLAGSVAERTAQNSTVPTLVVRNQEPLVAWAKQKRPLNVFVGYDFSASSDAALRWVASLAELGPLNVTVTYLFWPPSENWRLGTGGDPATGAHSWQVHKILERDLAGRCATMLGQNKATLQVVACWGSQDTRLLDLAKTSAADLIVVGTNQRRGLSRFWLGSVSRGVLHHAPMSVACVPASAVDELTPGRIPVFQRVLVPTDFSTLGNQAIPFAYSTLYRGGIVDLIHVVEPMPAKSRTDEARRKRISRIEDQLRALIPSEAKARWLDTKVEVVESHQPATAICQAAERFGTDLICIGSHGRSGWSKAILGSVAQDVMARSRRPVLVVRPPA